MILVTGGTGFIGRVLIRHLAASGKEVRTLIRPSKHSPNLPISVPVQATVCSLKDERGLRAAMKGVDVVYHLAGTERYGGRADLMTVDIQGTQAIVRAAAETRVGRIIHMSHLGADRASAYPVLKAKAIAEGYIRGSGLDYTIMRSAVVFGPGDRFSTTLAVMLRTLPFVFFMPGDGHSVLQPLWVEDLATSLTWALDEPATRNQIFSVGGPEYLTFRQIMEAIMEASSVRRSLVSSSPAYMRGLTVFFEHAFPGFPASVFWLDELAADRTCPVDTIPRIFGLMPARFSRRLDYLHDFNWRKQFSSYLMPHRG